jgi:hypothetical protein
MSKIQLPIANGFYASESLPISAQRCVNWYPNIVQTEALSQETLFGTPGIRQLVTTGVLNEQNRGIHVMGGICFFVNGELLYSLDRTIDGDGNDVFGFTSIGAILGSGPVSMADNGTELMILVPGGLGSIWDGSVFTADLQTSTSGDFQTNGLPQIVVFVDGYFVCTTDSKKFISSGINDGLTWNPLNFGTAEADPDDIRGAFVFQNQLFILGSETTQAFQNVGGTGFPFASIQGLVIPKGIFAPFSSVATTNSWMMVGGGVNESPAIWLFTGNGFEKISTTAIDNLLNDYSDSDIEGIVAVNYAEKGAYFTGFSLPDRDIYYDSISGKWHERISFDNGQFTPWRVGFMATAYGRVIVGDSIDGRIGELDSDLYTEYGDTIFRVIIIQPLANLGNAIFVNALELTMQSGSGDLSIVDPMIRMSYSDDAYTYSSELSRSFGKIGEYFKRVIWRRLGRIPRFRVFRFVMTDAVNPTIIKLEADLRGSSRG